MSLEESSEEPTFSFQWRFDTAPLSRVSAKNLLQTQSDTPSRTETTQTPNTQFSFAELLEANRCLEAQSQQLVEEATTNDQLFEAISKDSLCVEFFPTHENLHQEVARFLQEPIEEQLPSQVNISCVSNPKRKLEETKQKPSQSTSKKQKKSHHTKPKSARTNQKITNNNKKKNTKLKEKKKPVQKVKKSHQKVKSKAKVNSKAQEKKRKNGGRHKSTSTNSRHQTKEKGENKKPEAKVKNTSMRVADEHQHEKWHRCPDVCLAPLQGLMISCDTCKLWYHPGCQKISRPQELVDSSQAFECYSCFVKRINSISLKHLKICFGCEARGEKFEVYAHHAQKRSCRKCEAPLPNMTKQLKHTADDNRAAKYKNFIIAHSQSPLLPSSSSLSALSSSTLATITSPSSLSSSSATEATSLPLSSTSTANIHGTSTGAYDVSLLKSEENTTNTQPQENVTSGDRANAKSSLLPSPSTSPSPSSLPSLPLPSPSPLSPSPPSLSPSPLSPLASSCGRDGDGGGCDNSNGHSDGDSGRVSGVVSVATMLSTATPALSLSSSM